MDATKKVRSLLSKAGVVWRPTELFQDDTTVFAVGGVMLTACENGPGTLKLVAYDLTPEQVACVARGGAS